MIQIDVFKAFVISQFLYFPVVSQLHLWKWYVVPTNDYLSRGEIHSGFIAVSELPNHQTNHH